MLLQPVERRDVRVIELGEQPGFSLDTLQALLVLGELLGTNVARASGLSLQGLTDVQRAVKRIDLLARGRIGPTDDDLVRKSLYALAGEVPPADTTP